MNEAATATHCPYCALQCGMGLRRTDGPVPVAVEERPDFPVNRGRCAARARAPRPSWPPAPG
ncbi:hypothetical protein GCM10025734_30670 [Kitasatospora paranensis]